MRQKKKEGVYGVMVLPIYKPQLLGRILEVIGGKDLPPEKQMSQKIIKRGTPC